MITEEEKLLVYMKHQPYMTMYDVNEYTEMYDPEGKWTQSIPYITDQNGLRQFTFTEFVDWMLASGENA